MLFKITGFTHSKGISGKTGKPYDMAQLHRLSEIRPWKNDNGEGRAAGFHTDERAAFSVFTGDPKLVSNLLLITYPCEMDLTFEPHPEDPTRNVVTGFKVVESEKSASSPAKAF